MLRDVGDEGGRAGADARPDFLRGQLLQWMGEVAAAGKSAELFELEMWLQSFERFFRIKHQPLSEKETKILALRNWSEELRLVDSVMERVINLCTSVLTEEQVNQTHFDKYVEGYAKDEALDPYIERLLRQATPLAGLNLLREAFEDIHLILTDLVRISRIPYTTFTAVGKILYREVRRSDLIALFIDRKFKPIHDRITNPAIRKLITVIPDQIERRQAAKVFLEFFRLLHYLEYADPERIGEADLRRTVLVFSLITSETRLLLAYIEKRALRGLDHESPLYQLYDSFVYCVPLELKKVLNTELLDISVARQADGVRARVENSHGILKDCFQQSVVHLAQVFDGALSGSDIFPDFTAKREQSVRLRQGLVRLIKGLREFVTRRDEASAKHMKDEISVFYDHNIQYLMYRDWSGFELFFIEILKCGSLPALQQITHRFDTFLMTLLREVQKRSILVNSPTTDDLPGLETAV